MWHRSMRKSQAVGGNDFWDVLAPDELCWTISPWLGDKIFPVALQITN